jgi:hypothetical protein
MGEDKRFGGVDCHLPHCWFLPLGSVLLLAMMVMSMFVIGLVSAPGIISSLPIILPVFAAILMFAILPVISFRFMLLMGTRA